MSEIEDELKSMIVETLMLKDIKPQEIDLDKPLFADGLGLDSIDALELAVEIGRRYKVQIKSDDERNRAIFRSVRTLAAFIAEEKVRNVGKVESESGK